MIRAIRKAVRSHFAQYIVWDSCGTVQECFTMREAMEWLPACAGDAAIINRATRIIEVSRHQTRTH